MKKISIITATAIAFISVNSFAADITANTDSQKSENIREFQNELKVTYENIKKRNKSEKRQAQLDSIVEKAEQYRNLADKLDSMGQHDKAEICYKKAYTLTKELSYKYGVKTYINKKNRILKNKARYFRQIFDELLKTSTAKREIKYLARIRKKYTKMLSIYTKRPANTGNKDELLAYLSGGTDNTGKFRIKSTARSYFEQAKKLSEQNKFNEARKALRKAFSYSRNKTFRIIILESTIDSVDMRRNELEARIAAALNIKKTGDNYFKNRDYEKARGSYLKACYAISPVKASRYDRESHCK